VRSGESSFEQKGYTDAIDLLQRALAIDDSLREAHYYLGLTFVRVGRKQEAETLNWRLQRFWKHAGAQH
jgi:tetratricopeptide (TPR) repeat protein